MSGAEYVIRKKVNKMQDARSRRPSVNKSPCRWVAMQLKHSQCDLQAVESVTVSVSAMNERERERQ